MLNLLGARVWRSMNSRERSVYEDMATKDSNRYRRQMTQYTVSSEYPLCPPPPHVMIQQAKPARQ